MARRSAPLAPPPTRPALMRSRPELAGRLKERILLGRSIQDKQRQSELGQVEYVREATRWRDFNCDLLEEILTTDAFKKEYDESAFGSRLYTGNTDNPSNFLLFRENID